MEKIIGNSVYFVDDNGGHVFLRRTNTIQLGVNKSVINADGEEEAVVTLTATSEVHGTSVIPFPIRIAINDEQHIISESPFVFKTNIPGKYKIETLTDIFNDGVIEIEAILTTKSILNNGKDHYIQELESKLSTQESLIDQILIDILMGGM